MAPIFVGSNSDDTRIRSNRVGLAASTSDPGSASEGDIYYDSTNNLIKTNDGSSWSAIQGSGTVSLVASGSISNGQPVIITDYGKAAGVGTTIGTVSQGVGNTTQYAAESVAWQASTYDSNSKRVVVVARYESQARAWVGTVDGLSITFGSDDSYVTNNTEYQALAFDSSNNKIVVAYSDAGQSDSGYAKVGTVDSSDNSTSWGSATQYESGQVSHQAMVFDSSNNKIVIAYRDHGDSFKGKAVVGTVSGTSISFGSPTVYESGVTTEVAMAYVGSGKVVIVCKDGNNSQYGTAFVGTVSGTSISFGSAVVFNSGNTEDTAVAYDSTNGKVVVAYKDAADSNKGKAIVGTVSGTSISFGTPVVFNASSTSQTNAVFDNDSDKVIISYAEASAGAYFRPVTVSGNTVSVGSSNIFYQVNAANHHTLTFDTDQRKAVVFFLGNSQYYGSSVVFRNEQNETLTNLTTENYIGISDAAYSDGDTANIQIISTIDDAQTGLTTGSVHYIQNDGSLSTSAADPSVEAGTALSATEISIKN